MGRWSYFTAATESSQQACSFTSARSLAMLRMAWSACNSASLTPRATTVTSCPPSRTRCQANMLPIQPAPMTAMRSLELVDLWLHDTSSGSPGLSVKCKEDGQTVKANRRFGYTAPRCSGLTFASKQVPTTPQSQNRPQAKVSAKAHLRTETSEQQKCMPWLNSMVLAVVVAADCGTLWLGQILLLPAHRLSR